MIVIEGTLESIVYRNNENSYTVARISTEDGMLTIVGYFSYQPIGVELKLSGDMVYHKKFGEQFQVKRILNADTSYSNSMEAYLKSGAVAHIGPVLADNIIKKFGEDTYDIFKKTPERLMEVSGIGKKTYDKIMASFNEQTDLRDVMIELANFGIGTALGHKLFARYGEGVLEIIKKNPYRLIDENSGIGFRTADAIARESGVLENDINRIEAAMVYILGNSGNEGHCYLPLENLKDRTSNFLRLNRADIDSAVDEFAINKNVQVVRFNGEERAYISNLNSAENLIGIKINILNKKSAYVPSIDIDSRIRMIESLDNIEFAEQQKKAIKNAFDRRVLIITGGPGTGKTTTLKAILRIAEEMGLKYALTAPTGRAAKRMEEATGKDSKTIHRLLEYQFNGNYMEFGRNEENPLDHDMIIVDEMSMVDTVLLSELLKAVKSNVRIILLGDVNQIPSVGPGNVLKDLIYSSQIDIVRLDTIFRQTEGSTIVDNAHRINQGAFPIMNTKDSDFFMISSDNESKTVEIIKQLVSERLPNFYNLDVLQDIQVLAPMKKGTSGVVNLNYELQKSINPPDYSKNEMIVGDTLFRVGDKVMQTKNNYQIEWKAYTLDRIEYENGMGIYNGDIGFITEIDPYYNTLRVNFDSKEVEYGEENVNELNLAYAITIHKSQGSEFPAVVIPIHYAPEILANRNLIYTAITRAKKLLVLVGKEDRLQSMIANTFMSKRYTGLEGKIKEYSRIIQDETEEERLFNMR
ncbi:MAG: ATP-dependent RecD-like DNA helicase [Tissierellia bacterium]|jgi:exodeoxyribonuclease V alpha subunit|nr:ATP-dependent RecD-like DNA helicase [Tissierellia bacterium]